VATDPAANKPLSTAVASEVDSIYGAPPWSRLGGLRHHPLGAEEATFVDESARVSTNMARKIGLVRKNRNVGELKINKNTHHSVIRETGLSPLISVRCTVGD
jgi:hypothetical protein